MPDTALAADITIEELTALALAADPDAPIPDDAVPFADAMGSSPEGILPEWYMPATAPGIHLEGWRRRVAWLIIGSSLAVVSSGLCNTYGHLVLAW